MVNYTKEGEFYDQYPSTHPQVKRETTKSITADDDWKSLQSSTTYLFHNKKLKNLELDVLNEKVRNVASRKGETIVDCYKDSILKIGMIVLREAIKEKKGPELLDRLGGVWTSFYKSVLPMLQAIFYPILLQEQGTTIRAITLLGFRDIVLLKTKIADSLEPGSKVSPDIKQMFLVLAGVQECSPPSENYLRLEKLVSLVITPYLGTSGLCTPETMPLSKRNSSETKERKLSVSMLKEEMSRKFRRSGSLTSNNTDSSNNNKEVSSFKKRFKIGESSASKTVAEVVPESAKSTDDNDMLAYLEERKQRWKHRDEMLISESLIG